MHSNTALLLAFVASASAAVDYMAIPHVRRELNILPRATPASQDSVDDTSKCASEALDFVGSLPTPPPQILSDLTQNPQTDPCDFTVPKSLSAEYSSYEAEVLTWFSSHKSELSSLVSECSDLTSYTSLINVCTSGAGGSSNASGPNTASAVPSSSGSSSPSKSSSASGFNTASTGLSSSPSKTASGAPVPTNAASAHEPGMAFAALAAAGIAALL
ncbi:hypothetical protein Trco_007160 [Trichoderma cornu-damae]|uniref:DUF7735 domain-containing protein n=1 Tax=Trichoderma cornu-damae TaxID=654480 RepID=A0A9P8TUL0_9HYPO|nr:hypothetical protein Trco_007160 [Trichoderma cornu-damae]